MSDNDWVLGLRPQPERLTAEAYEALPEDIARSIEIVDGYVVFCEAPIRARQRAGRRLANLLERSARAAMSRGSSCLEVDTDVDLRLRDLPLLNRRPDVVLYNCLDPARNEGLRAEHVALVIEIVSPGSETRDTTDKVGEYAKAGIPHYWIVWLDTMGVSTIEVYQLDRPARAYKHVNTLMKDEPGVPSLGSPIPIEIEWAELEF